MKLEVTLFGAEPWRSAK